MNKILITLLSCMLLAPSTSFVRGMDTVDVQKVTVKMEEKVISDHDITLAVKDAISKDIYLNKFSKDINIKVDKGIVTLSGKVDSVKVKSDLEMLIKGVLGVKGVVNNIEVQSLKMEMK